MTLLQCRQLNNKKRTFALPLRFRQDFAAVCMKKRPAPRSAHDAVVRRDRLLDLRPLSHLPEPPGLLRLVDTLRLMVVAIVLRIRETD